ncbi:hypothetical protein WICPIJ_009233 [Wickerhamomyces pijperi]|uniref:Securin n=1 Tax=Wickerhamomyces pijperi TaxID=599730 RepID=A0A9P8PQM4_WICPI|nr:hypothetical protein WICPIJ_009233 [Wickerhamomyces pijperi]
MDPSKHQSQVFLNKENINIPIATKHQQARQLPSTPPSKKPRNVSLAGKPKKLDILKDGFKTPTKNNTSSRGLSANLKRVPLGNKDGNSNGPTLGLKRTSSSLKDSSNHSSGLDALISKNHFDTAKNNSKKLHTPSTVRSSTRRQYPPGAPLALNQKLKVLKDEDFATQIQPTVVVVNRFQDDDEIEFGPGVKVPPMLDTPTYYDPLTEEELRAFERVGTDPRLINLSDTSEEHADLDEEFELDLNYSDDDTDVLQSSKLAHKHDTLPNYMKPTAGSIAKSMKLADDQSNKLDEDCYDGLSVDELNNLIDF